MLLRPQIYAMVMTIDGQEERLSCVTKLLGGLEWRQYLVSRMGISEQEIDRAMLGMSKITRLASVLLDLRFRFPRPMPCGVEVGYFEGSDIILWLLSAVADEELPALVARCSREQIPA